MTGFTGVLRRELWSLWVTPMAWSLLFVFLTLQGFSFSLMVNHFGKFTTQAINDGPIQGYFTSLFVPVSLLLLCPALSMRTLAEERSSGTIEALLTAPVTPLAVALGKYCAILTTYLLMWAPTVLYAFILRDSGTLDWPVVGASYLCVALIGASYLAIGLLMSALTKSQLVAMLMTTLGVFGLFILGIGEKVFDPGPLWDVCHHVSVLAQMEEFSRGVIDLRRVVFDLSIVAYCLILTTAVIDSWRTD